MFLVNIDINYISTFYLEISCPSIPPWKNIILDSDIRTVGTVTTYSCMQSYSFETNISSYNVTCLENGRWNSELNECKGS